MGDAPIMRLERALEKFQEDVMAISRPVYDGNLAAGSSGGSGGLSSAHYRNYIAHEADLAERVHEHAFRFVETATEAGYRGALMGFRNRGGVWELQLDNGRIINYVSPFASSSEYNIVEKALQITFEDIIYKHRKMRAEQSYYRRDARMYATMDLGVDPDYTYSGTWESEIDKQVRDANSAQDEAVRYKKPQEADYNKIKACSACKSVDCEGVDPDKINFLGRCPTREKRLWKAVRSLYWHRYAQEKQALAIA